MLLAFDTATPLVTVALHDGTEVAAEHLSDQPLKHGEQLAPLIEEVMAEAGITRFDLTAVAAGVGPGPYTGLRVGLVTARTELTPDNRPRKYYRLTDRGKKQLAKDRQQWESLTLAMGKLGILGT